MTKTREYYRKCPINLTHPTTRTASNPVLCSVVCSKKSGTVHKVLAANKNAKALGSDRRDEMRYALRAKISQKDYVDKEMKHYHYGKAGVISNGQLMMNGAPAGALNQHGANGYSPGMDPRAQGADVAT